jgi:hypothetical protein
LLQNIISWKKCRCISTRSIAEAITYLIIYYVFDQAITYLKQQSSTLQTPLLSSCFLPRLGLHFSWPQASTILYTKGWWYAEMFSRSFEDVGDSIWTTLSWNTHVLIPNQLLWCPQPIAWYVSCHRIIYRYNFGDGDGLQWVNLHACMCWSWGEELKKMFKENGSFEAMEISIRKKHIKSRNQSTGGGWYSEQFLKTEKGWSKTKSQLFCPHVKHTTTGWNYMPKKQVHLYDISLATSET